MIKAQAVGLDALQRQLGEATKAAKRAADANAASAAERIASDMRSRAPVDKGALRASIRTEPARDGGTLVRAGGTPETMKEAAGGTVDEAVLAEYGTTHSLPQSYWHATLEEHRSSVGAGLMGAATDAAVKATK